MQFDMNRTWSQTLTLVKGNFQLLAIVAGVFMLLPALVIYIANPEILQVLSLTDPEAVEATLQPAMLRIGLFGLAAFILQMIGHAALMALISGERPTVGEAIRAGVRALPSVAGAVVVFFLGLIAAMFVLSFGLSLILSLIAMLLGSSTEGAVALTTLVLMPVLIVFQLYVMVRFMMTLPVIVLEHQGNPLKALGRSWRLTRPRAWAILGFIALLGIAYFVILMVVSIVLGAIGAVTGDPATGGSALVFGLVISLVGALVAILASGILVSIHQQLSAGAEPPDIEFDA
jgi:membrane-anchored glycerophosphoryl diester phosphodiesterase (GDPDase)